MKTQKICMLTGAVAAALFSMGLAQAAETATTEDVKVTAARVEQELLEVPMSVSVVTAEQIKTSSARTIGELLEDIPGVQITNSGSQGLKRLSIRGEDSFRTLVMIDGQKVSEQKSMDGTAILIDPTIVERIEVIKGPASVLYGSDAIGGAINIITKKGGDKPFGAEAAVGWNGAGHGWSESASVYGGANGFKYRLSGNYQSQEDTDTPKGRLPHTAYRQKSANLFLSYDITDNVTAGIQADIFDSHLRSGSISYDPNNFYVDIPEWKREKVNIFVDAKNVSDVLTRVRWDAYWQKTRKQMNNHVYEDAPFEYGGSAYPYGHMLMDSAADNRLTTIGTSIQTDWQLGENNYLITGYEFSRDNLKADTHMTMDMALGMTINPITGKVIDMGMNTETFRRNEAEQTTHAIFASMETILPADFTANYGVRYTYVKSEQTVADSAKYGTVTPPSPAQKVEYHGAADGSAGTTGNSSNSRFVFNAGLTWTGIEDLAIRATWAQGFRTPLLQEKYLQNNMGGGTVEGNPDLKPEKSNNFEIGARFNRGPLSVDATVFYSLADDFISQEKISARTSKYFNADEAKAHGLELAASYKFFDAYTPYATVTWMKRKIEAKDYSTYDSGTPEFFARYGLRTQHEVFGGQLTTDTYARSQVATKTYSPSTKKTSEIAGFTTFNFAAGYAFGKDGNYTINAEFLNIFDQLYQYNDATYEPGRHFNVKLTARY